MKWLSVILGFFNFTLVFCQSKISINKPDHRICLLPIDSNSSANIDAKAFIKYYLIKSGSVTVQECAVAKPQSSYSVSLKTNISLPSQSYQLLSSDNSIRIEAGLDSGIIYGAFGLLEKMIDISVLDRTTTYTSNVVQLPLSTLKQKTFEAPFTMRSIYSWEGYDNSYTAANRLQIPFYHYYDLAHTFETDMLPRDSFFNSHPEYYAVRNGQRTTVQPNLVNNDLLEIVTKNIRHKISKYPPGRYNTFSVSLNDNAFIDENLETQKLLQKEGGAYMGVLLNFVNKIADSFPSHNISTLAYMQTKLVPRTVKPRPNVTILLTNADIDKSKPIELDGYDVQQHIDMRQLIPQWVATAPNLVFWEYTGNFSNPFAPWPTLLTLKPNLLYLKRVGVKQLFFQQVGSVYATQGSAIKSYLTAQLMFNPNLNDDSLINTFCKKYFKQVGKLMYTYYLDINKQAFYGTDKIYTYDSVAKFKSSLFSFKNVIRWKNELSKALKLSTDKGIRKKVLLEKLAVDYVYLQLSTYCIGWNEKSSKSSILKDMKLFESNCSLAGVTQLDQAGHPPSFFVTSLRERNK